MQLLILDTATSVFSAALCRGDHLLGEVRGGGGPSTAARLAPAIQTLFSDAGLTPADLEGFAVTVGPGSFTGLRVGLAFIKGLAYATGRPVVELSSLALLAMNARGSRLPVCPLFDARKSEVYAGLYRFTPTLDAILPDRAAPPATFLTNIEKETLFLGDGALRYREEIVAALGDRALFAAPELHQPTAAAGIPLALAAFAAGKAVSPAEILPRYLRLSEAELNRKRP